MHVLPDAGWCEEEDSEPAECLDWPLDAGFYGLGVFWESVLVPDVEIQHWGRARKIPPTPNCTFPCALAPGGGTSTLIS